MVLPQLRVPPRTEQQGTPHAATAIHVRVATAAGWTLRRCWTVTKQCYLSRVPKALFLDAVREGARGSTAARLARTRKVQV